MRRRVFNVLLVTSLVLLAAVLWCYAGKFEFDRMTITGARTPPVFAQRWEMHGGRFAVWTYRPWAHPPLRQFWTWSIGFRPELDRRAINGFDAHPFPPNPIFGGISYLFSFPLWVIVLPCMIAPLVWLRARRRQQAPRGFPIELATAAVKTQTGSP